MPFMPQDPRAQFRAAATMDHRSPWLHMMLQAQQGEVPPPGFGGNPPPFIPVPIPIPPGVPPGAASSTSVPPRKPIKGESEMLDFLMRQDKKNRKGWREDLKQYDDDDED